MTEEPVTWHYGLMAERWSEFITEAREAPYFLKKIAQHGQPVLDVACGTGRLLLPLLQAGIDIDGCDISGDMLHHCERKAIAMGLSPHLYNYPMHAMNLPRRYKTIYMCDAFGLAGSHDKDLEALRQCYTHLEDGGALLLNIEAEYTSQESWELWLKEKRRALPQPWPEESRGRIAADGSEHIGRFRYININPLEQTYTRQVRLEKWNSGKLVASEEYSLRGNFYFKNELLLMLRIAGFREITVSGNYTDESANPDHEVLVFTAIK